MSIGEDRGDGARRKLEIAIWDNVNILMFDSTGGREHAMARILDVADDYARAYAHTQGDADAVRLEAAEQVTRDILVALCERGGVALDSDSEPGTPARNWELAVRLGIGQIFGITP